jgi:hypothetical protein
MRRRRIAPLALLGIASTSMLFGTAGDVAAKVHALVIGINDYNGPPPKLKGAVNDANDVAKALRGDGVEDVTEVVD